MAVTIKGLRVGLVVLAVALLAVIAGYMGYARRHLLNYGKDLAGKYGLDISNEGVSFSHTFGANTQFKLHAARQVEYQNGKMTLRDVGIVLYGAKADRADRIHGNQFDYDPKAGVLTGVGQVFIDLAAPASDADRGPLKPANKTDVDDDAKMIHVKTTEVTFLEKEGSASTSAPVEFMAGGMTGTSVGATYNSKTGVIVLESAVHLSGLRNDRPVVITAARAEMDRQGNLVKLERAKAILETDDGARTVAADHSIVYLKDGNPERIDGEGHVEMTGDGSGSSRGVADGDRMQLNLNPQGQPQTGFLAGNVRFRNEAPARQEDGRGAEAQFAFDAQGRPVHSVVTGDVEMNVREGTSLKRLNAAKVDMDLGGGGKEPVYITNAVATGGDGARLRMTEKTGKDGLMTTADGMRADVLVARFADASGPAAHVKNGMGPPLVGVDGTGKTYLEEVVTDAMGALQSKQTSTGDVLKVNFRTGDDGKSELERAEQRGSVVMDRELIAAAPKPRASDAGSAAKSSSATVTPPPQPQVEHARADDAVYVADLDETTLTGNVEVQDAESALFADKVVTQKTSGDSTAEGAVKVSYLQAGSKDDPVHVLAARAISHKATGLNEFFAAPGGRARMWQGGSQVEAPVIDFDQTKRTLVAKDVPGSDGVVVKTVIVDSSKPESAKPNAVSAKAVPAKKQGSGGPMRVLSQELIYTDATRLAEFKGKVRAEDADGVLYAQDALVYLSQLSQPDDKSKPAEKGAAMDLGGRVDHMIATGAVVLVQPGRKATGEKLTYTASDQVFVLTGTKAAPPKMVDEQQGTTTGAALRFRSGDDSVVVLSGADARHVESETHMKQGGKS